MTRSYSAKRAARQLAAATGQKYTEARRATAGDSDAQTGHQHLWMTPAGGRWGGDPDRCPVSLTCALCPATIAPQVAFLRFRVTYNICSGLTGGQVSQSETTVTAENEQEATGLALDWVHDNDRYCDDRIEPIVSIGSVERLDEASAPEPDAGSICPACRGGAVRTLADRRTVCPECGTRWPAPTGDEAAGNDDVAPERCRNCGAEVEPSTSSPTGWTHIQRGGGAGSDFCNPEHTPGSAHTLAEPYPEDEHDIVTSRPHGEAQVCADCGRPIFRTTRGRWTTDHLRSADDVSSPAGLSCYPSSVGCHLPGLPSEIKPRAKFEERRARRAPAVKSTDHALVVEGSGGKVIWLAESGSGEAFSQTHLLSEDEARSKARELRERLVRRVEDANGVLIDEHLVFDYGAVSYGAEGSETDDTGAWLCDECELWVSDADDYGLSSEHAEWCSLNSANEVGGQSPARDGVGASQASHPGPAATDPSDLDAELREAEFELEAARDREAELAERVEMLRAARQAGASSTL